MTLTKKLPVPNAILLVMDRDTGEIPESMGDRRIFCTPSSVVVGTLPAVDGETEVTLSDQRPDADKGRTLHCLLRCNLDTPKQQLSICTVHLEALATFSVASNEAYVEIWVNDECVPSIVWVVVVDGVAQPLGNGRC
jgi:hypothetical protein